MSEEILCTLAVHVRPQGDGDGTRSRCCPCGRRTGCKLIAEWDFFCMLRDEGRRATAAFLEAPAAALGVRSTLDLDALLEGI